VTKIAVIIPYFQRTAGLLRRAVASILAQEGLAGAAVSIIIVDDESPSAPEGEVNDLARDGFSIRIVKQRNGGPAKARNAGLAASAGVDAVAFLDSDDWWAPGHLSTGMAGLRGGADFYFANNFVEEGATWFDTLACRAALLASAVREGGVMRIARADLMALFLKEYIAHTSTVIFNARALGDLRFDETQATAGEDYLFWLTATDRSDFIAFSETPMAFRGRGLDLYRSAYDWSSPECVRRLYFNLSLHKKLLARFCRTPAERADMRRRINLIRREILYLFVRNARAHVRTNAWVLARLAMHDGGFWWALPYNAVQNAREKLSGRLAFEAG
jgi:succinoglycan biosynthesis protein ExoW